MSSEAGLAPGLYLVATPIGNLEDITLRALRVLRECDRIACEDTRQTGKLLGHFGITTPTVSYHDHNELSRAEWLLGELQTGSRIAVVSDAGTPSIADPGAILASGAIAAGIAVFPIPGANAATAALIASGLPTERFSFHGFLPAKEGQRVTELEALRTRLAAAHEPETQIFYEAPHRIIDTLRDVQQVFGQAHRIAVGRELTKLHEEFLRGTVSEVRADLTARDSVRGEIVLLLDGKLNVATNETTPVADAVKGLIASGLSEKNALKQVAKDRKLGKSEAYREYQRTKR